MSINFAGNIRFWTHSHQQFVRDRFKARTGYRPHRKLQFADESATAFPRQPAQKILDDPEH
jgi:hypothetical protein